MISPSFSHRNVLVAPLDWGLGHATRCIPIIHALLEKGITVTIAGEGDQKEILQSVFPGLAFLSLTGYRVKYAETPTGLAFSLIMQLPKLMKIVRQEHRWLTQMVHIHRFDAVISDNRFGLWNKVIPSYFITHQLEIRPPFSGILGKLFKRILRTVNYRHINRFTECWVPDHPEGTGYIPLAGELSHPRRMPQVPVRYIGLLSRFSVYREALVGKDATATEAILAPEPEQTSGKSGRPHLFITLSGPEPQRSLFEDLLIDQLSHYAGTAVLVRGLPQEQRLLPGSNSLRFYNHLPTDEYAREVQRADLVIARAGYSTIMDLVTLNKRAILVPTPGQTEQEYLARYLHQQGVALAAEQRSFNLNSVIESVSGLHLIPLRP